MKNSKQLRVDVPDSPDPILVWKIQTFSLLGEIANNGGPSMSIMLRPLQVLARKLAILGQIAARIQDPELTSICVQLALWDFTNPASPDYDKEACQRLIREGFEAKVEREKEKEKNAT